MTTKRKRSSVWKPVWLKIKGTKPRRYKRGWMLMTAKAVNKRALRAAIKDIGETEHPANSNMNKYGKYWAEDGVPWCGLAIAYWWQRGGHTITKDFAHQIDYVPQLVYLASNKKNRLRIVSKDNVRAGDAVAFDFPGGASSDHVGLFERWVDKPRGVFTSIEGNTSYGSDANGGQVMRRTRTTSQVQAFVRKLPG